MPETVESILSGVDAYIVTHLHPDHIDINMQKGTFDVLEHDKPIFVQNEDDAQALKASGFQDVHILKNDGLSLQI